jgi:hypothetical protein
MTKLSNKILDKIKKEKMTPKPRWYFVLMHTLLGTAILTSIFIGGIAIAIVIRHFTATDWELARLSAGGNLRSFFMIIPYIWIIFIGFIIFLAEMLLKYTKKGYRIESWKLALASIALSIILGGLFFITNTDQPIEKGLREKIPPYEQWENKRNEVFVAPEKGVLAGEIIEIGHEMEWIVIDFEGHHWFIDISEAKMRHELPFEPGMFVGIKGEMIDEEHFRAIWIAPWKGVMRSVMEREEEMKHEEEMRIKMEINERKFRELPY